MTVNALSVRLKFRHAVTGLVLPEISFEEDVGRSTKNIGKQPYAGNVGFPPACFIAVVGAVGNSNQGSNLFLSVIFVQSSLFQLFGKTHGITSFEIYFNAALGCFNSKESIGLLSGGFGVQTCWMYAIECNMLPREIMLSCWRHSYFSPTCALAVASLFVKVTFALLPAKPFPYHVTIMI